MWLKMVSTCLKTAASTYIDYTFSFFPAVLDGLLSGMAWMRFCIFSIPLAHLLMHVCGMHLDEV